MRRRTAQRGKRGETGGKKRNQRRGRAKSRGGAKPKGREMFLWGAEAFLGALGRGRRGLGTGKERGRQTLAKGRLGNKAGQGRERRREIPCRPSSLLRGEGGRGIGGSTKKKGEG